jgi:hypothetical protein
MQFEELTQQLEVEEKIKAGAENLLKVHSLWTKVTVRFTTSNINQQKQNRNNLENKLRKPSTYQTPKSQISKTSSKPVQKVHRPTGLS